MMAISSSLTICASRALSYFVGQLAAGRRKQQERQDEQRGGEVGIEIHIGDAQLRRQERDQDHQSVLEHVVVERAERLGQEERQEAPFAQQLELIAFSHGLSLPVAQSSKPAAIALAVPPGWLRAFCAAKLCDPHLFKRRRASRRPSPSDRFPMPIQKRLLCALCLALSFLPCRRCRPRGCSSRCQTIDTAKLAPADAAAVKAARAEFDAAHGKLVGPPLAQVYASVAAAYARAGLKDAAASRSTTPRRSIPTMGAGCTCAASSRAT
jgi:hypothetical protein